MDLNKIFYFTIPKILIIKDIRLGILHRFLQFCVLIYMFLGVFYYEYYYQNEIPTGYVTGVWADIHNMYQAQKNYSLYTKNNTNLQNTEYRHCQNVSYNYIYDSPYWEYSNIRCINIPYIEAYQKTEEEVFFMTHFTENHIQIFNCNNTILDAINNINTYNNTDLNQNQNYFDILENNNILENYNILDSYQTNDTNIRCRIIERLDKNCICHNYNNYFVNGIEYMNLSFDYRYLTTFEKEVIYKIYQE